MRLDICAAAVGRGVVVTDETDGGSIGVLGVSLQCGIEIAFIVELDIVESLAHKFLLQVVRKDKLFVGAWDGVAVLRGLRVEFCVFKKSFYEFHKLCRF